MVIFFAFAAFVWDSLVDYTAKGLDYLRRAVLGDPPATSGVAAPYTPPFTGGQCYTTYNMVYSVPRTDGTVNPEGATTSIAGRIVGSYKDINGVGVEIQPSPGGAIFKVPFLGAATAVSVRIDSLSRADGQPDNCGDLPNPNPPPSPASDGLAFAEPPDFSGAAVEGIVNGTALAVDGSAGLIEDAGEDFVDAGALAPIAIADALVKIAAGLAKLVEVLGLLNDLIDLLKKLFNKDNKSSFSYNFGNLRYDGFVRLQSEPPSSNITPLHLDLQTTTVKIGASRIFGEKSPNYYNREPVGYIHFVSSTFGVLSSHEIRFARTSIPIPGLAYGFFYNMGLDGVNRANATGFYLKQEE